MLMNANPQQVGVCKEFVTISFFSIWIADYTDYADYAEKLVFGNRLFFTFEGIMLNVWTVWIPINVNIYRIEMMAFSRKPARSNFTNPYSIRVYNFNVPILRESRMLYISLQLLVVSLWLCCLKITKLGTKWTTSSYCHRNFRPLSKVRLWYNWS